MKKIYYIVCIGLIFLIHSCLSGDPQKSAEEVEKVENNQRNRLEEIEAEIIRKFDCDTTDYLEFDDFEYQLQEKLKKIRKPLLLKFVLGEIFEKDDSTCIITGWTSWSDFDQVNEVSFTIKRSILPDLERFETTYCVVQNPTIGHYTENKYLNDDQTNLVGFSYHLVLKGECIYIEQP